MPNAHASSPQHHRVSVLYGDGSHSFWLARGATLAELAVHVGGLDALHDCGPLTIDIALDRPRRPAAISNLIAHTSN